MKPYSLLSLIEDASSSCRKSSPYSLSPVFRNRTKVLTFSTSDIPNPPIEVFGKSKSGTRNQPNATLTKGAAQTTLSYQYESRGNRLWQKANGSLTTYSYNSNNNELRSSSSSTVSTVYSYDANGYLLTRNVT